MSTLIIEDERVKDGYRGIYFPDLEMSVAVSDENRAGHTGWRINGRVVPGAAPLAFRADRPTHIEALFEGSPPGPAVPPSEVAAAAPPPPARLVWRTIPAGTFWMGCVPGDTRCGSGEKPRVEARIPAPFQMLDREVAAGDFAAFAAATGRQMPRQPEWYADAAHPVVNATWDEAQAYCAWAGGRLPSEEEWEYAARGGLDGRLFPWGDEFTGQANAQHNLPAETWQFTSPVGSFPPNGYGLHDMAGNVWEWTSSPHRATHDSAVRDDGYDVRTIKGGSWNNLVRHIRLSERDARSRQGRHNLYVGFRCIRSAQS